MPFDNPHPDHHWFALAVESRQEFAVRKRLCRANIAFYLPEEEIRGRGADSNHRNRKTANPKIVPFIRGYVFVRGQMSYLQAACEEMPGAISLLRGAQPDPTAIPDQAIEAIRRLEDQADGVIRIRQATTKRLKAGQKVRVNEGAWGGLVGQVLEARGEDRVKLLINGFKAEMPALMVSAA